MNDFSKYSRNKKSRNFFWLLFFVLVANTSVFGQSVGGNVVEENVNELGTIKEEKSAVNSNTNFVIWFMGSKQTPNTSSTIAREINSKRQIITTGIAPNRLLIRAFLKKVVNFENALT